MKSFIEKYKPKDCKEIPQQIQVLKSLIQKKKHVLIYGPTGSCKTCSVYTIAEELDYEIIEVNASDFRTKNQIDLIIGQASEQQSLFQKEKILLIDEADCISGNKDRGGPQAILNILKNSKFSVILIANDPSNEKLKEIKRLTTLIEFKPIPTREIIAILKKICEKEKIIFIENSLKTIALNCNGDIRAAINELQSSIINKEVIELNEPRDYEINLANLLSLVFKTKNFYLHRIMENLEVDLDEYSLWLDENIPLEYSGNDLFNAYELFSKGDVFKGRIHRWQHWRFLYYQTILLSSGISVVKKSPNHSFTAYKKSMRPLKIWQANMQNSKMKSIAEKMAISTHISTKEAIKNFRLYKNIINEEITKELRLTDEEIEYLKNN